MWSGSNTMDLCMEKLCALDDDDLELLELKESKNEVKENKQETNSVRKRKFEKIQTKTQEAKQLGQYEEGEIMDWYTVCANSYYFDTAIMKRVPGCNVCLTGGYCGRPRRIDV